MEILCPYCKQNTIIKKGKRKKKQGAEQKYYCTYCKKTFVQNAFRNKTYTAEMIREAITLYNQGLTYEEAAKTLNKRFKTHTTKSSVHRWNEEYKDLCTYSPLRISFLKQYGKNTIVSKSFDYQGLAYNFKYHIGKLDLLIKDYPSLVAYIKRCEAGCPPFFNTIKNRCSQIRIKVTIEKTISSKNPLCRRAVLALSSYSTKKKRHSLVENFMLINDDATVAVEVPIWLWEKNLNLSIAGHIDLIQISNGFVYILYYKPELAQEKDDHVASQLYLYASGLSFRTSIPLDRIRCAWFDDRLYVEFEPTKATVHYTKTNNQDTVPLEHEKQNPQSPSGVKRKNK